MKKFKFNIVIIITILLIISICTFSSAATNDFTFDVVDESTATIKFGSKSYAERSVVSKDLTKREITFQLKLVNEETSSKPTGEIMLVIDNSQSMIDEANKINGKYREELVINSAKTLITNLLKDNSDLKIGAVSFSTKSKSEEAIAEDAQLVSEPTNNADDLISKVSNIQYNGPRTDLDAGITLAKKYFSDSTDASHKYVIILTDGVPNVSIGSNDYYSDTVINKTKTSLQSLSSITNNVFVMLTGITNGDENAARLSGGDPKTFNQIIEEIFGTADKPTIGKFYYITDDKIEETITDTIYKSLMPTSFTFKDFKLVDTFTQEIVDNFTFSYVKDPNYGTISPQIDTTTNSITWTIPELKSGETAIVQYKLTLKDNFNDNIVNTITDTHKKMTITYTDNDEPKTTDVTPKVKITEVLPTYIPQAGKVAKVATLSILGVATILIGIKYYKVKNNIL